MRFDFGRAGFRAAALLAVCAVLALATSAFAQHAETTPPADPHAATEHAAEAHPAPSIMRVEPGLMIWTVITFLLLLVVLQRTAWKPLMASLDAREGRIRQAVEGAEKARKESEDLLAKHRHLLDEAKSEAQKIIEEGRADGLALKNDIQSEARKEAGLLRERALREVELATDQAKKELWTEASKLSIDLAERIMRKSLDANDQKRLVEHVLDEYRAEKRN